MIWIVRAVGVICALFGGLGLLASLAARAHFSFPEWPGMAWSVAVRAWADVTVFALVAMGGMALVGPWRGPARWVAVLGIVLAAAKLGYDVAFADQATARGETIIRGSIVGLAAMAVVTLGAVLAPARS